LTPEQLLAHVESLGIHLAAEGGRLRVNAPRGGLTDALKASIGAAKDALIALLERRVAAQSAGIQPRERASARSVSSFQERLWILQRMEPGNTAYNMVHVWKNAASADAATVVAAIGSLLVRHEILRSSFDDAAGTLAAHTLPPESVPVEVRDLNTVASAEQRRRVEADLEVEVRRPFDLTVGPAVRFIVYRISATETATLLAAHHIAVDAWSIALVEQEIAAACAPGAAALDVPRLQYADYAAWQRTTQDPKVIASDLEWWSRYLARAPQLSAFPADLRAAADTMGTREVVGATRTYVWNQELTAGIRTLARKQGATLYMALMAACATVLRWHTGQEDLVLGSPMGVRERTELETMIGPFVNLMLVRLDITGNPTFAELLRRTRDSMLEAHEHRHVPFETLVERLKPVRSLEHSPLFQVAIVQHNAPDASDGSVRANGGAMHELTWFAREIPAGLECSLEYRADLYSPAAIDRIAAHLEAVLRRAVENSERRAGELSVLPNAELAQIEAFNATSQRWEETTFVAQFERRAAASPESTALAYEHVALSYDELNRRANRLAHQLRVSGVSRGSLVALCVERSPSLIVALLAILKAGGTYVPLDPGFPMDRLSFMLADSGSTVLLTSGDAAGGIDVPERVTVVDLTYEPALQSSENLELEARPEDAAYIIYTSGSTGRPKGVAVSHGSLMNFLWSMAREPGLEAADVLAAVTTISFDIAGLELYLPLLVGARVELVARETAADGPALAALLTERGATVLQATPATWRLLVEADWHARPGFRGFCGGEALPRDLADSLLERVGELWNLYGPTETTIWSSVERVQRGDEITIGHPIANTQVYIVGNSGELQPIGVPGEIWIGGEGVAIGYHHRPELTAERFVAASFGAASGRRLYRTGDLGRWRGDGRIEHLGRLDDQVKIRGFRIELGEIESVLATLAAVRQAVVVARDAGPSDRRLVAYVVYQPGEDLTVSEVRRHLRGTLPDYMVPSLVVAIDAIPLTPNGKMDRAALPDPFQNARAATAEYEAPVSQMERLLADVWTDVLKVERVGLHDNFFELGGHSLLSLRVAGAVQKRSGWRMDPRTLFFQTLSQIAATGATAGDQVLRRA
jgi:amino acid adenylation domain-containing protein